MACRLALRLTFPAVPAAAILALLWGPAALAAPGDPALLPAALQSCAFSALKSAVAAGGTIDYGQDCSVTFTASLTVPTGRTVKIEANGHSVTFNGNYKVRLFQVTGGSLTIGGIGLIQAEVSTAGGAAGGSGGNGTSGSTGANGASGAMGPPPARTGIQASRARRAARQPPAKQAARARTPRWPEAARCSSPPAR
jgi:hypothetical protein